MHMSRIERGFYPLSKIEHGGIPTVLFDLNLPMHEKEKIGVNVRAIEQLCNIGGIRTLYIAGKTEQSTSDFPHFEDLEYINIPTYSFKNTEGEHNKTLPHQARWTDTTIELDINEMSSKISQNNTPKEWAAELNYAIKNGISDSGSQHLIVEGLKAHFSSTTIATLYGSTYGFMHDSPYIGTIGSISVINTVFNIANQVKYRRNKSEGDEFRWSLFHGPQLDRALILKSMAQTKRLVKELPKSEA